MKDLTESCRKDLQESLKKEVDTLELRSFYCVRCKNAECGQAQAQETNWEQRIRTQEDRFLNNPNFGDPASSRWEALRAVDFPSVMSEVLEIAANQGSWEVPSELSGQPKVETSPVDEVEQAVRALRQKASPESEPDPQSEPGTYIVEVESQTSPGVVYDVTMQEGKAKSCNCAAGSHGRSCLHLRMAEVLEGQVEAPVESPPEVSTPSKEESTIEEPNKRSKPRKEGFLPPEFPRYENTPQPVHGRMVGRVEEPADGLRGRVKDPWKPPEEETQTKKTPGGLTVTLGGTKK